MAVIGFFTFLSLLIVFFTWFNARELKDLVTHEKSKKIIVLFLYILMALMWGWLFFMRKSRQAALYKEFNYLAYGLMGLFFILSFYLLIQKIFFWEKNPLLKNNDRREFLKKGVKSFALFAAGAQTVGGVSALRPQIVDVKVPLLEKYPNLINLKILQITDLHIGPMIDKDFVDEVVEKTNAESADVIVITGDLLDGTIDQIQNDVFRLKNLKSKYGVYYCSGNHEFYWGGEEWLRFFEEKLDWKVLRNRGEYIHLENGSQVYIGGVDDISTPKRFPHVISSPQLALSQCSEKNCCKILLAHQPKSIYEASEVGFDLQLSGHTHAGQFFPWTLLVGLAHPYVRDLNLHEGKTWIYVSPGTGFWGPPNRLGARAEISRITFV